MLVVLAVEDDEQVRVLAESILKEEGYETLSANNVNEALALLRSDQKIDVLFTDIQLGTDFQGGLDLAQEAVSLRPKIPVVYSSGRDLTDGMRALFVNIPFICTNLRPSEADRRCGSLGELVSLIYTTFHGISGVELLDD